MLLCIAASGGCTNGSESGSAPGLSNDPSSTEQRRDSTPAATVAPADTHAVTSERGDPTADSSDRQTAHHNVENKFDAHLRQALRQAARPDTTFSVLIELDAPPTDAQRSQLENASLKDVSLTNRIATAAGTPEALRAAAALPFVRSIALSRSRPPLD